MGDSIVAVFGWEKGLQTPVGVRVVGGIGGGKIVQPCE